MTRQHTLGIPICVGVIVNHKVGSVGEATDRDVKTEIKMAALLSYIIIV